MRIAALSDIHGNISAARWIWNRLLEEGLAGSELPVLNAGDTVAYGPATMECIEFVRDPSRNMLTVGGNYDYNVSRFPQKAEEYKKKWGALRPDKFRALQKASDELKGDAREWLANLPRAIDVEIGGARFSISHYVPGSHKEGLFSGTPDARLLQIAAELDGKTDVVVTGHTHSPFVRVAGDVLFVNPGTVGRSLYGPTYAEITLEPGQPPSGRIISCRDMPR